MDILKHKCLKNLYQLSLSVEGLGCSEELTEITVKISDLGVEGKIVEISHDDVIDAASLVEPKMTLVIKQMIKKLDF